MGPSSARILGPLLSLADSALRCPRSPPPRTAPRKLPAPRGRQPRPALPVRWTRMCARWGDALLVRSRNQPPPTPTPKLGLRRVRSEEHTSELQSRQYLVCRLLLEKKPSGFT